jgi:hypothetical protein
VVTVVLLVGAPVHIDYGKVLLLCSDVVHGGGTPNLEYVRGKRFDHLHMYLDTEDQKADPGNIHSIWYDGITPLSDLYWKPIKEFPIGKASIKIIYFSKELCYVKIIKIMLNRTISISYIK